jgi:hypothetical protein
VTAGVAVLAFFGWFRTRRFEKVTWLDLALAVCGGFAVWAVDEFLNMNSLVAAIVVASVLAVVAPRPVWLPPLVVGVVALLVEPWGHLVGAEQQPQVLPWTALALAAGLLVWAVRRRSVPVAVTAAAFGALSFVAVGTELVPLAAAALLSWPRDRTYPFFAGGVVLLGLVLFDVTTDLTPPADAYPTFVTIAPVVLLVGALVRRWLLEDAT